MRNTSAILVSLISGCVFMVACTNDSGLGLGGQGGSKAGGSTGTGAGGRGAAQGGARIRAAAAARCEGRCRRGGGLRHFGTLVHRNLRPGAEA